ncbi:MAG: VOC family protein [Patescibacteria group bacterium]
MDNVVHFEIPTEDLNRAKTFYQTTFGWEMQDMPEMNYIITRTVETDEKFMPKIVGAINGGMMKRNSIVTGPSFAINVKSIDEAVEKIKTAGGAILQEKMPVSTIGFIAYFKDPEGNVLSLWQNAQ